MWKIDELLDTIKGELEAREASEAVKRQEVNVQNPPNPDSNSSRSIPTVNALVTTEGKEFFNFDVFIAMGSITQPPARRFDKRKIEETFFKGIIDVLFASKLAMR